MSWEDYSEDAQKRRKRGSNEQNLPRTARDRRYPLNKGRRPNSSNSSNGISGETVARGIYDDPDYEPRVPARRRKASPIRFIFIALLSIIALVGIIWIFRNQSQSILLKALGIGIILIGLIIPATQLYTPRPKRVSRPPVRPDEFADDDDLAETYQPGTRSRGVPSNRRARSSGDPNPQPNLHTLRFIILYAVGLAAIAGGAFIPYHFTPLVAVHFHPTGTSTAIPTTPGSTVTPSPSITVTPIATGPVPGPCVYTGHSAQTVPPLYNQVLSVAWSPDGKSVVSASRDGTAQVWDSATCKRIATISVPGGTGWVLSVAWSPNGNYIAVARQDTTVLVWDVNKGMVVSTYKGHTLAVNGVAWSSDSQFIASVGDDNTLQVWNATTPENLLRFAFVGLGAPGKAVAWSPDGKYIATGDSNGTVQLWDATNGNNVLTYSGPGAPASEVDSISWSPNSRYIAVASRDKKARVWDVTTRSQTPVTVYPESDLVLTVAWSPDGKRIASGSADTTVQVWLALSGKNLYHYIAHTTWVYAVAWSPDGRRIASGSADTKIEVRPAT